MALAQHRLTRIKKIIKIFSKPKKNGRGGTRNLQYEKHLGLKTLKAIVNTDSGKELSLKVSVNHDRKSPGNERKTFGA